MDILIEVADWIKVLGSIASICLAIYFIVKTIKTYSIAKKPIRDRKKQERIIVEIEKLQKELKITKKEGENT